MIFIHSIHFIKKGNYRKGELHTFHKKKKEKKKGGKTKTKASRDGLLLQLYLNPFLGKLSRNDLRILGALTRGNGLEGLNGESWLLSMSGLSINCRLCSLLGRFRVQIFMLIVFRPLKQLI